MGMICPFCGVESKSKNHCTHCQAIFNDEVRSIASNSTSDFRNSRVGPFSTQMATIFAWTVIGVLVAAFVVITQIVLG